MWKNLDERKAFQNLVNTTPIKLNEVLTKDRITKYVATGSCGFKFLYAARPVDDKILDCLQALSDEAKLLECYKALLSGEVVNLSETRMVLHHLTRGQLAGDVLEAGKNKREFYTGELQKIKDFCQQVHSGKLTNTKGKPFTDVVQIGIGGSDLGPRACYLALRNFVSSQGKEKMRAHFISNVDPDDAYQVIRDLGERLDTTLFILVSKSGTTQETLANEMLVKKYLTDAGLDPSKQMLAVTSETSPLAKSPNYLASFFMDDHIGGRYSSTSVCGGLVLSLSLGFESFQAFLEGAHAADQDALEPCILKNPSLLDALIGVYESSVLGFQATAILPYSQGLSRFPAHLQQLDMESNGKTVNRFGEPVMYKTGPIIFGESGTNGQHSFYQSLHQGSHCVPLQFIGFASSQCQVDIESENSTSQEKLNANLIAQIVAFARGKVDSNKNKHFEGNRPSSLLFCETRLEPKTLGYLLAHYENKVMFQGFAWNLNSFDQEGVQLGKLLTKSILTGQSDEIITAYLGLLR